jgi:uncharacterized protein (DUF1330 family)
VPAYVVYQGEVIDPERYEVDKTRVAAAIAAAGGQYSARGGAIDVLEGDVPDGRTVLLEFPTVQAALDWHRGEAYAAALPLREAAVRARMYVVDGAG